MQHEHHVPPATFHILAGVSLGVFRDGDNFMERGGRHGDGPFQSSLTRQGSERLHIHVNLDAVLDCLGPGIPRDNFRVIKERCWHFGPFLQVRTSRTLAFNRDRWTLDRAV